MFFFLSFLILTDEGAVIMEVNHDSKKVFMEQMKILPAHMMSVMVALSPSPEQVASRFQAPIVTTYVDTEKIRFDRFVSISCDFIMLQHMSVA